MLKNKINPIVLDFFISLLLAAGMLCLATLTASGQNIGVNNPAPHVKALLDLTSTDKGMLIPRMTQAQRQAIFAAADATAKGMLVYQADNVQGFYYYDGAAWQFLANGNAGWNTTGNTGTSPATHFMGTTDSNAVVFKSNNTEVMRLLPNKKIGIGTVTPGQYYYPARLEIADEDGQNSDIVMRVAGTGFPDFAFMKQTGTLASPAVTVAGNVNGAISAFAFDGNSYRLASRISFLIDSNSTVNDVAGSIRFYASNNNASPEIMRLSSNGNVGIGAPNPNQKLQVNGNINIAADSNYRINNVRVLSTRGNTNLFAGANAGINNTGFSNTFAGDNAGAGNTGGNMNTFFGMSAGIGNGTAGGNVMVGYATGTANTANANTFIGAHAGQTSTTGTSNVLVGYAAGTNNSTGQQNVIVGNYAGFANGAAMGNTFVGFNAGTSNNGNYNAFFGHGSGASNTTGTGNTFLGSSAGITNTTGSQNTYVGNSASGAVDLINATAIGNNAYAAQSNTVILGYNADIGIGTSSPLAKLDIFGSIKITDGTQGIGKVLTSDASGLATWQTPAASPLVAAWERTGNSGTNAATDFVGTTDATDLVFRTGNMEKMRIDAIGNIGMSAVPSVNAKLSVGNATSGAILGTTNSNNIYQAGVSGINGATSGTASGVYGSSASTIGYGVFGYATATSGANAGVYGQSGSSSGSGVTGTNSSATGTTYGVRGSVTSTTGYSGNFSGGRFAVTGNAGFGTTAPNTQLDVDGALSLRDDVTLSATATVTVLTVGNRSYFRVSSNATASTRILSLTNGLETGQILIIEYAATGINGVRIADNEGTYNTNTPLDRDLGYGDVITLIWNGATWLEMSYANN